jgi:hypothetical protein
MATTDPPDDTGELQDVLARIAARRVELNRLDDHYQLLIKRAEDALRALGIGMRISIEISSEESDRAVVYTNLVFDKIAGSWRLAIESGPDDYPEAWQSTLLASMDRELRFSVFRDGYLRRLTLKALETLDHAIESRKQHLQPSANFVTTLEATKLTKTVKP